MSKPLRRQRILELVKEGQVSSQERLRGLLREEGLEVTQSTLSRDIKELSLVKGAGGYRLPAKQGGPTEKRQNLERSVGQYLIRCAAAQNLVVLRTQAGHAHPLAVAVDQAELAGLLGTVAGDDTVLLIAIDNDSADRVARELLELASGRT